VTQFGQEQPQLESVYRTAARICFGAVFIVGAVVCCGWMFDIEALKQLLPNQVNVPSSTGLGLVLISTAMLLLSFCRSFRWMGIASKVLAVLVLIAGAATFAETIMGAEFDLKFELWRPSTDSQGLRFPAPMAPTVSVELMLLSLCLLLPNITLGRRLIVSQICALAVFMICSASVIINAGGAEFLCIKYSCIKLPISGAVLFGSLSLAYLFHEPNRGVTAIFVADGIAGKLARRLSGGAIAIPIFMWLRWLGVSAGYFDQAFGWALLGLAAIAYIAVSVAGGLKTLDSVDAAKAEAQRLSVETTKQLEQLYSSHLLNQSSSPGGNARVKTVCLSCGKQFNNDVTVCPDDGYELTQLADDSIEGTIFDQKYHILSLLGKGGMSSVYKAKQILVGRDVALKVLQAHLASSPESVKRFRKEALALGKLSNANLVSILDFGISSDGKAYLVMDFLKGQSLDELLKKVHRLDIDRFLNIFIPVCDGLSHAHGQNVVHRDLKPGNIMLLIDEEGNDVPKIVDFGLAKFLDDEPNQKLTQTGDVFGSPLYMSPEQCMANTLDARTDVYGLGCVMYECLTGTAPLIGSNVVATINMQIQKVPDPFPRDLRIPAHIEKAVLQALEKDPDKRQQSVLELKQAIAGVKKSSHTVLPR